MAASAQEELGWKGAGRRADVNYVGLKFRHVFSSPGTHPFDEIKWDSRKASISNDKGQVIFQQTDVEVPASWSQLATNVVVSKYFHGPLGSPTRERSVKQLIERVARTIKDWGDATGYFETPVDGETFYTELTSLLVNQYACFNSPVWFNMGVDARPQCSACFINSVKDSMSSILELAKTEGLLFKFGSGTGTNFSTLRGSAESLAGGGIASGPVSFMRGFDAFAGVIKSGGKTRRSAKMVILDCDHPDIEEFIECKVKEERKAWALMAAGYSGGLSGDAYSSIFFQNSNNSVRVSSEFMQAVERGDRWGLVARNSGEVVKWVDARGLLRKMAECAHVCGDPGIQYDTTINDWHTCADTTRINASNPCSEYMFIDDTACNLASLNLMKFRRKDRSFDVGSFREAVRVMITAMDIIVDNASYPTPRIENNSHAYRPLGLGYANLGALLMSRGVAYDSDEGRATAGAITSIMTGEAYRTSAELAERLEPFAAYDENRTSFLRVMRQHRDAISSIDARKVSEELLVAAQSAWDEALEQGVRHGYKNSQVSVLAPTGTIAFFMDCDTTGVEPDIALVKYKKLAGGGLLKIVNNTVPEALEVLGYGSDAARSIVEYITANDTIEGAPGLAAEHLSIFDCAFKPAKGSRSIAYQGHLRMMEATQPFLSGAISKTVNLPEDVDVNDIFQCYLDGWKKGLKAVAVYRDGSKKVQPLATHRSETAPGGKNADSGAPASDGGDATGQSASAGLGSGVGRSAAASDSGASKSADAPGARANGADAGRAEGGTSRRDAAAGLTPAAGAQATSKSKDAPAASGTPGAARRRHLPSERAAITHKFSVGGHEGYITVGMYEDRTPGEIFIVMSKEGSTVSGLMDGFATAISMALQYGVPLPVLVRKFSHMRFEPSGFTGNPEIRMAKSILDYIFRWLGLKFLGSADFSPEESADGTSSSKNSGVDGGGSAPSAAPAAQAQAPGAQGALIRPGYPEPSVASETRTSKERDAMRAREDIVFVNHADAPPCPDCGQIMVRNGACYKCFECGATSGCS